MANCLIKRNERHGIKDRRDQRRLGAASTSSIELVSSLTAGDADHSISPNLNQHSSSAGRPPSLTIWRCNRFRPIRDFLTINNWKTNKGEEPGVFLSSAEPAEEDNQHVTGHLSWARSSSALLRPDKPFLSCLGFHEHLSSAVYPSPMWGVSARCVCSHSLPRPSPPCSPRSPARLAQTATAPARRHRWTDPPEHSGATREPWMNGSFTHTLMIRFTFCMMWRDGGMEGWTVESHLLLV